MSEMVERAAKAAYTKWIEGLESIEPPWEQMPQDFRDRMVDAQRAAIKAMRSAMMKMGIENRDPAGCIYEIFDEALK